nr:hypothetical protein [Mycoplasmopsis bovis]
MQFLQKISNDILEIITLTHFDSSTAYKLYVIAILRCAYSKMPLYRDLKFYYWNFIYVWIIVKRLNLSESLLPDFFDKNW